MSKPKQHRKKPRGLTGPIKFADGRVEREFVQFPDSKPEIEALIAKLFCTESPSSNVQFRRYGFLDHLTPMSENSIDFVVQTKHGERWLELAEFAPLDQFGGKYEEVPNQWSSQTMKDLFIRLVKQKNAKEYGDGVILLIYKTHDTLFVPPPVQRMIRAELSTTQINLESIYYLSPHSGSSSTVWEIWPGNADTIQESGIGPNVFVGLPKP
ncbi:hypothetical protein SAMN05518865_117101 [Duganella sp. CF458]|uniref:hypothetical protein n=1 Tax=Duganella sp. CF458 TaxID=1884368 RepID=UPI0008DFAC9D|nr:hypothetical protein [Duganella sp. CF458]SFG74483.1 hypothetical protein SAMN05518865_117101 [Duganella sp. CF458]